MRNLIKTVFVFGLTILGFNTANAQRITVTVAGNGISGHGGDGGLAKSANIAGPAYICTDQLHNVYFVDGSTIRKVSAKGIITTIGGGGTYTADGIPATTASIAPQSICADAVGNVYLVTGNKIKKIDAATNIITTFAGTGVSGYSGDGGPATSAQFNGIAGICTDLMGNVIVADRSNQRIRKIIFWSGVVTTIAGNGLSGYTGDSSAATAASLSAPNYICASPTGDIYFTDQTGAWIRSIDAATGNISTYAGGGGGIVNCTRLHTTLDVSGMCFDQSNNLCWNETSCSTRKIDRFTDSVSYIAGNFVTESYKDDTNSLYAWMNNNCGLAMDVDENMYVADRGNNRIRKLIKLTSTPAFEYGKEQSITPCPGYPFAINTQMAITDLDMGQTETWTVLTPPVNGTLTGFPATAMSCGVLHSLFPSGLNYTAPPTYSGVDSFRVRVSDGVLSDTVVVYVSVQMAVPAAISGVTHACEGATVYLSETTAGGIWVATNSNASVNPSTGVVTAITAGLDTIMYNTTSPCPLTSSVVFTVNPVPSSGAIIGSDSVCVGTTTAFSNLTPGGQWTSSNPAYASVGSTTGIVTGLSYSTSTTIRYTVSNTWCSSYATKTIFVNSPVATISGPDPLCIGSTATYTTPVTGGIWSVSNSNAAVTGAGLITGIASGADTIFYANTNSCGTASVRKPINITPPPLAGTISGPSLVCTGTPISLISSVSGGRWQTTNSNASVGVFSGVVNGYTAGADSILYTVSTSPACSTTVGVLITIEHTPSVGTITGPATVCPGSSISLHNSYSGGIWSVTNSNAAITGSGVLSGIITGTDSVLYTVTNVCGSAIARRLITINAMPYAGAITGSSNVCEGSSISLTNTLSGGAWSAINSHAWVSGSGIVSGVSSGSDSVRYIVTNTCGAATAWHAITINSLPDAGSITGIGAVCTGAIITLTNPAPGGIWSATNANATVSGLGVILGVTAGIDTILYSVTNTCGTGISGRLITIDPMPYAGVITGPSSVCEGAAISLTNTASGGAWSVINSHAWVSGSGVVSGVSSGSDSVRYIVTNTCGTATVWHAIAINSLPDAGSITGLSAVCAGSIITLTNLAPGGIWSATNANATISGPGVILGITAGIDTILYSVTNTCGTGISGRLITVNYMPTVDAITGPHNVCMESSMSLFNTTPSGIWSASNTNATISGAGLVTGVSSGLDTMIYNVANACGSATAAYQVEVNKCDMGSNAISSGDPMINIYPNPASSTINIEWTNLQGGKADMVITDCTGRIILKDELVSGTIHSKQFDLSGFADGVYLMKINSGADYFTRKLVLAKQ